MTNDATPPQSIVNASLIEDGTMLRVVLNKPKGNILTMAMMQALSDVLISHAADTHLRLVLIRGAGGHFSFGASVEEHKRELAPKMLAGFHSLIRQLAAYPVPLAAMVEGSCLGGAFELILTCHFVFATPTARLGCPEIKLGVVPPVLAAIGALRLGSALAESLILTGDTIDASAAKSAGLVYAILESADPEKELLEWYRRQLRPVSAFALRQGVRAARRGPGILEALQGRLDAIERQYINEILASHDGNEGIDAFIERRQPVWEDS